MVEGSQLKQVHAVVVAQLLDDVVEVSQLEQLHADYVVLPGQLEKLIAVVGMEKE